VIGAGRTEDAAESRQGCVGEEEEQFYRGGLDTHVEGGKEKRKA